MILKNHVRNEFGKTDTPANTIRKITDGFDRLGYDIRYIPYQVADHIHWSQIGIDAIKLQCQGKGLTPELARASAHAELPSASAAGCSSRISKSRSASTCPPFTAARSVVS